MLNEAYKFTKHQSTNPCRYSCNYGYDSNILDAGMDDNMYEFIKSTMPEEFEQYNWVKSTDGTRYYITVK